MEVNKNEVKNWGSKFFPEDGVQQQWRKRLAAHKSRQEPQKNGSISPCIWEFEFFDLKFWRLFLLNSKIWKEGGLVLGSMKKCLMGHTDGGRADNTQPPPNNTWGAHVHRFCGHGNSCALTAVDKAARWVRLFITNVRRLPNLRSISHLCYITKPPHFRIANHIRALRIRSHTKPTQ